MTLRLFTVIALSLQFLAALLNGQAPVPSREYVRLGDRLIAIEGGTTSPYTITISPATVLTGAYDPITLTATVTSCVPSQSNNQCVVSWPSQIQANGITYATVASSSPNQALVTPVTSVTSVGTGTVVATLGNSSSNPASVTIYPLLNPASASFGAGMSSSSFQIDKEGSYTVSASSSAITLSPTGPHQAQSGQNIQVTGATGLETIAYSVTSAGGAYSISFSGLTPTFAINVATVPLSVGPTNPISVAGTTVPGGAGSASFNVSVASGYSWQIQGSSLPNWIWLPGNEANFEDAPQYSGQTVTFNFSANPSTSTRSGTICVDAACDVYLTVNQAGGLTFTPATSPSSPVVLAATGSGASSSVAIAAPSGTSWTAAVDPGAQGWLQITSGASGTGDGTLNYTATNNTGGATRSGSINIGGLEYYISQSGSATVTISPGGAAFFQQNQSPLTFTAKDGGGNPVNSNWSLSPADGTISPSSGTSTGYTAPATLSGGPLYTYLTATDIAVPTSYGTAAIELNYGTSGSGGMTWNSNSSNGTPVDFATFQMTIPNFLNNLSNLGGTVQVQVAITTNAPGSTPWPSSTANSCYLIWTFQQNRGLYAASLADDASDGNYQTGFITSSSSSSGTGSTVLANSQCEVDLSRSYMSYSSPLGQFSPVTVNMAIYFRPGWAGSASAQNQSVYIYAPSLFNAAQYGVWTSPGYDAPGVGITAPTGSATGTSYMITGWSLDRVADGNTSGPQTAISSVNVYVDGVLQTGGATLHQALPSGVTNYCSQYPSQTGISQAWDCNGTQANFGWSYNWNTTTAANGTHAIQVVATDSDPTPHTASAQQTFNVSNVPAVATPTFSPGGGTYGSAQTVTISSATSGATIVYTTDGSTPSETHGTASNQVTVNASETVMAMAYKAGLADSGVASATYTIAGSAPWYSTSWQHRKAIIVNPNQVPSTQTNFPMLVSWVSDPDVAAYALTSGYDIIFTDSSGNLLNYQRELYDSGTGQLIAWVNVPSLSSGTVIYMYFGNILETTDQQNPSGTWDSHYVGVYHLANGTTLSATDSTSNANNGTITGATATSGQMDGAGAFSGSNQYIDIGDGTSLRITGDMTIEAWVNPTNYTNYNGIVGKTAGTGGNIPAPYDFYIVSSGEPTFQGLARFFRGNGSSNPPPVYSTSQIPTGTWSQIAATMSGTSVVQYLNGATNGSGSISGTFTDGGTDADIASRHDKATTFKGAMDEVRISNIARSGNWITTSYNNQHSPNSFFSEGPLQSLQVATPTLSPGGGTYTSTQTVTISSSTSGASIRYTTDGSTPTETHGTFYAGPITISSSETVKAIAYEVGLIDSTVASAPYTINSGGGPAWYNTAWQFRKAITVNSGQVPSTQTNFPMLVSLASDSDLAVAARPNGYDIVFTDSSGTNVLNYERELYNSSTGQLIAWVNVPSLSNGAVIYMYFGNTSETMDQQNPSGTWDSHYVGVYHLANGSTLSATDSTSNANNGTITGATATGGQMDGAAAFSGSNQYIDIGNGTSLKITGDMTIEAWINLTDYSNYRGIVGKTAGSGGNIPAPYDFYIVSSGEPSFQGLARFYRGSPSGDLAPVHSASQIPTGTWSQIAVTMAGSSVAHYLNGSTNGTGSIGGTFGDGGTDADIGTRHDNATMFKGSMDEVRISNIARSASWITTGYNNQSSPGSFLTLGARQGQ